MELANRAEQVKLVWPTIDNDSKSSSYIRISIYSDTCTYVSHHRNLLTIKTEQLCVILEYLREKNMQIAWEIILYHDPKAFEMMTSYVCNGDILHFGAYTFNQETVGNILGMFQSIRFDRIKIFHEIPDSELLSLVWHIMRTDIYYAGHNWTLYEHEDC